MKKLLLCLLLPVFLSLSTRGQENHINSGFYLRLGPAIPVGKFATDQVAYGNGSLLDTLKVFSAAKTGFSTEFGYLIYIGPAFANHRLRAGIDAIFFSGGFNKSTHPVLVDNNKYDYWYFFFNQRFGPMITVNPVDRLMIDLSYKLGFAASEYNDEWGYDMKQNEITLGIRYRLVSVGFSYDWGTINYNDFDKSNPKRLAEIDLMKIMVGLKF